MSSTARPLLGNDLVDLRHPRLLRGQRDGFARLKARILSPEEIDWLAIEPHPDRLWILWAAKEVAFKVRSKVESASSVFRPREFTASLSVTAGDEGWRDVRGRVSGGGMEVALRGWMSPQYVHLIGSSGRELPSQAEMGVERIPIEVELDALRDHFSSREWRCIRSVPSAWVRILAKRRLLDLLGGAPEGLEIVTSERHPGERPPRVLICGKESMEVDVSLSHHGRYVAWAVLPSSANAALP
jgi:hypothetical protein